MPITAGFTYESGKKSLGFSNISGYRISTCFTPGRGFQGRFYVYVFYRVEASEQMAPVLMGNGRNALRGTLQFVGDQRSYSFENIDLVAAEPGMTGRQRYQILEFSYVSKFTDEQAPPVKLDNDGDALLDDGALRDDFKFHLDDFNENLLGFRARQSADEKVVLRFVSMRNKHNSWLPKIIQVAGDQAAGGKGEMPGFDVHFAPGVVNVARNTLLHAFVDESYGELLRHPHPTPLRLVESEDPPRLARLELQDFTPAELYTQRSGTAEVRAAGPETIETATFVFNDHNYHQLPIR